jgi:hypothetical protein
MTPASAGAFGREGGVMNILRPYIECKHNGVYIWQNCKSFAGELKQTSSVKVNLYSTLKVVHDGMVCF